MISDHSVKTDSALHQQLPALRIFCDRLQNGYLPACTQCEYGRTQQLDAPQKRLTIAACAADAASYVLASCRAPLASRASRRACFAGRGVAVALCARRSPIPNRAWPTGRPAGRWDPGRHARRARTPDLGQFVRALRRRTRGPGTTTSTSPATPSSNALTDPRAVWLFVLANSLGTLLILSASIRHQMPVPAVHAR